GGGAGACGWCVRQLGLHPVESDPRRRRALRGAARGAGARHRGRRTARRLRPRPRPQPCGGNAAGAGCRVPLPQAPCRPREPRRDRAGGGGRAGARARGHHERAPRHRARASHPVRGPPRGRPCGARRGGQHMSVELRIRRFGRVPYEPALGWQEALVARRLAGGADALLVLEHPPVYTLGRGADARFLGAAACGDIPVVRVGRGGQVTYHGPGQLVGYPIIGLRELRPDVRWYVRGLVEGRIGALRDLGIVATRRPGLTGVWVGTRKIGSIGVAIRRWVTWHGFSLNVAADLSGFAAITPCGLDGVVMTLVAREGGPSDLGAV